MPMKSVQFSSRIEEISPPSRWKRWLHRAVRPKNGFGSARSSLSTFGWKETISRSSAALHCAASYAQTRSQSRREISSLSCRWHSAISSRLPMASADRIGWRSTSIQTRLIGAPLSRSSDSAWRTRSGRAKGQSASQSRRSPRGPQHTSRPRRILLVAVRSAGVPDATDTVATTWLNCGPSSSGPAPSSVAP